MEESTEMTPFAAFLEEHMYSVRPVIKTRAALARIVGLPKQTVNSWFAMDIVPRPTTILKVANRLNISARQLLEVAGYEADVYLTHSDHAVSDDRNAEVAAYANLSKQMENDTELTLKERRRVLAHINELRKRYEAIESGNAEEPDNPKASLAR